MKNIIDVATEREEFVTLDDGYVYYWPSSRYRGAMSANDLRSLADELDKRNKDWDDEINKFFNERAGEQEPLGKEFEESLQIALDGSLEPVKDKNDTF